MRQKQKNLWIDTRLSAEEMDFLHHQTIVTNEPKPISKIIEDKDDWFYENVLKKSLKSQIQNISILYRILI